MCPASSDFLQGAGVYLSDEWMLIFVNSLIYETLNGGYTLEINIVNWAM